MKEIELVHIAIEKLFNVAQIQATWDDGLHYFVNEKRFFNRPAESDPCIILVQPGI